MLGINPTSMDDSGEGLLNAVAIAFGLDPLLTQWQPPPSDPGDHTPPVITLTQPANATRLP